MLCCCRKKEKKQRARDCSNRKRKESSFIVLTLFTVLLWEFKFYFQYSPVRVVCFDAHIAVWVVWIDTSLIEEEEPRSRSCSWLALDYKMDSPMRVCWTTLETHVGPQMASYNRDLHHSSFFRINTVWDTQCQCIVFGGVIVHHSTVALTTTASISIELHSVTSVHCFHTLDY